jgi:hypothetical protein
MIFLIPQYFAPNLTDPVPHSVSALVSTPKMSRYDFGRRRNSNQGDPANCAPLKKAATMKSWAIREKSFTLFLQGARLQPAG